MFFRQSLQMERLSEPLENWWELKLQNYRLVHKSLPWLKPWNMSNLKSLTFKYLEKGHLDIMKSRKEHHEKDRCPQPTICSFNEKILPPFLLPIFIKTENQENIIKCHNFLSPLLLNKRKCWSDLIHSSRRTIPNGAGGVNLLRQCWK